MGTLKKSNEIYKKVISKQLSEGKFCELRKENQMEYLFLKLKNDFKNKNKVLDACCGYGRLIYFMNEFDNSQSYIGIDYMDELINLGKQLFNNQENIRFICNDIMNIGNKFEKSFDISINYKTLSWLEQYETIIEQLIKVTKKKIYITSLFWDGDIDFITKIYQNASTNNEEYTFLNTYSLKKFSNYCIGLGAKEVNSENMHINIDLESKSNESELSTYTKKIAPCNGVKRLEFTGNVLLNWKLIEIVL